MVKTNGTYRTDQFLKVELATRLGRMPQTLPRIRTTQRLKPDFPQRQSTKSRDCQFGSMAKAMGNQPQLAG